MPLICTELLPISIFILGLGEHFMAGDTAWILRQKPGHYRVEVNLHIVVGVQKG